MNDLHVKKNTFQDAENASPQRTLADLAPGESGVVKSVGGEEALHRHLLDMGLTPGVTVLLQKTAPMGDPIELRLRGYALTLRLEDAGNILLR